MMAVAAIPKNDPERLSRSECLSHGSRGRGCARVLHTGVRREAAHAQPEDVSPEELLTLLDQSEHILTEVHDLDPKTWFKHFAFGVLDRDKALRFILIHNRHHLRIISDIVAA